MAAISFLTPVYTINPRSTLLDATHAVVFSQLQINAKQQGVHAFIVQIRDERGSICPRIRIADCGHKIGLNGVDNGRIWFDNARVPRENLLNSVADVSPDGQYISSILNPEKRFGAFMAPLTGGRVSIAVSSVYKAKLGLAIAIRYALTRRAFSLGSNSLETLLLDYPSYQHRLLPLLAKTYAMSFAANELKEIFLKQKDVDTRFLHMIASGYKAMLTWHNIKTLQECRAACGGQALKSENRIGCLTAEFDAQLTFEGDNNVLMQQVSKVLLLDYMMSQKKKGAVEVPYLEHLLGFAPASLISSESSVLRDADFQICIFHLREQDLLLKLWNEVHCKLNEGASLSEALTTSYQTAGDLGQAFSEKAALEACIRAETTASDDLMKLLLGKLRSLYVLSCIDGNPVFLRNQYLFREQCMAIQQEIVLLCAEVRPHALTLVESFGIPHQLLGPIAFDWIECNAWSYAVK